MEDKVNAFIKFLTENNYQNTLVVFQNELRTDEKPSFREMPRFDPTSLLPDDETDKPSERKIDIGMFDKKETDNADQGFEGSFNNSFGMEQKQDRDPDPFGSFEESPDFKPKKEDDNGDLKDEPFFESKRVVEQEIDNPLSENEPDKFSFCEDSSEPFNDSFGEDDNTNRQEPLVQDSTRENGFNYETSQTTLNNFNNQTNVSQNPFSEVQQEFQMGFNSIIPPKTKIMVPSYVDNGKLKSNNKVLGSRDRVPQAG